MTDTTRESQLVDVFTTLADTLVADYDVISLLQTLVETCAEVFDVTAAGILLVDKSGQLEVAASTSEASRLVEIMQIDAEEGPCMDCFTTGKVISVPNIAEGPPRWERFRDGAREQGFQSVYAIPLRLRDATIGALNLLREHVGELNPRDIRAAQALADVATIGVLHERSLQESSIVQEQLRRALGTRVLIEQAKGVLSHTHDISTEEAFELLRKHARSNRMLLARVAEQVIDRTLSI